MKRHGHGDSEGKQSDKRPRLHQVASHSTHTYMHDTDTATQTHMQNETGLVALPSALVPLLLSFLPGRSIPSLLGMCHAARRLCAYIHELDLSSAVRFLSSLVRLRLLNLSECRQLMGGRHAATTQGF